jgi:hypothetical protein
VPEACELIRQAALGLQAAHERGLVHRDVKPSNLMLARANAGARVVVIDWGLVKLTAEASTLSTTDDLTVMRRGMGTADYMAPEQGRDARSVDIRADVYSLGATLYCLLAGKPPFHDRRGENKLLAHEREAFPAVERLRADVPGPLLAVLDRMAAKQPARRYATPGEVAEALRPFCCAEADLLPLLQGDAFPNRPAMAPPAPRRRRVAWLLAGAAVALLAAVGLGFLLRGKSSPTPEGQPAPDPAVLGQGPAAPVKMSGHPGYCGSLVFTPDGLRAVSESGGGGVYVWDLRERRLKGSWLHGLETPDMNQESSGVVAVSPDGRRLVAAFALLPFNYMNYLALYDRRQDKDSYQIIKKDFAFFSGSMGPTVAFSPDGSRLAAAEWPGILRVPSPNVRIIEVPEGKVAKTFPSGARINALAFSTDGKSLLLGGHDGAVSPRSLDGDRVVPLPRSGGAVTQVGFSADGKHLWTASDDGKLRVGNVADGVPQVGQGEGVITTDKNGGKMTCAAFWPGGRALTGHANGDVVVWDLATGEEAKRFTDEASRVTAVAVSPDGYHALAARRSRGLPVSAAAARLAVTRGRALGLPTAQCRLDLLAQQARRQCHFPLRHQRQRRLVGHPRRPVEAAPGLGGLILALVGQGEEQPVVRRAVAAVRLDRLL